MNISLSAFAPENLVSRDGFGSPVPRQPAHLHTQAEYDSYCINSIYSLLNSTSFTISHVYEVAVAVSG